MGTDSTKRGKRLEAELALQALLAEYAALRQEIDRRSNAQAAIVAIGVSALGLVGSLALQQGNPAILLAVPFVMPFVFAVWMEHHGHIGKIGYYVRTHVETRVADLCGDATGMGWESFLKTPVSGKMWPHTRFMDVWLHMLFGGAPSVALIASLGSVLSDGGHPGGVPPWSFVVLWLSGLIATVWAWSALARARPFPTRRRLRGE